MNIRQYINYTAPYVVTDADNANDYANAFWQHLQGNKSLSNSFDKDEFFAVAERYYNEIYSLECAYFTYPIYGKGGNVTAKKVPYVQGTEMQIPVEYEELKKAQIDFNPEIALRLTHKQADALKDASSYRSKWLM